MDKRQAYALAHPLNNAQGRMGPDPALRNVRRHARGFHILTILAVDR